MTIYVRKQKVQWERRPRPLTIGLALGGGAGRGLAHIGVLQVLEENGIFVSHIAGTSVGALIGGLYAAGVSPQRMQILSEQIKWRNLASINIPTFNLSSMSNLTFGEGTLPFLENATGLFDLDKLESWMDQVLGGPIEFKQLNIPFVAVATDLVTGDTMALNDGPIAPAIHASCSVPGIFAPVSRDSRLLVDGAISYNLPVTLVREMGADYVIAVDILPSGGATLISRKGELDYTPRHIIDITVHAIYALVRITQHEIMPPDCTITPAVGHISFTDLKARDDLIAGGRAATEEAMPRILEDLKS